MPEVIAVDSAALWEKRQVSVNVKARGIFNFQVCCGGGGWPTPHDVGIYLDADFNQCCIINWPRPCKPVKFTCDYGEFVVHLDTATEHEIATADEVEADFFRDN